MLRSRSFFRSVQTLSKPTPASGRLIHSTAPALKKKGKGAAKADEGDAFDDGFEEDDLFGGATSSQVKAETVMKPAEKTQNPSSNADATAAKRAAHFEQEKVDLMSRLDPKRSDANIRAKKTAIRSILRWADTPAQLETVKDLVAEMRKAKIGLHQDTAKEFFGRCITLHRPDVALQVLAERPRYRLDLDLNTARDLLHSIFVRATLPTPLSRQMAAESKPFSASHYQDALLLAGLYPHFQLGEVSQDPVASALLMSMFTASRTTSTSELPQVHGLPTHGSVAKGVGRDLLKNTQNKRLVHLATSLTPPQPFLHRHQVWLDSELSRADVKKLLTKLGFDSQSLSSLGVSAKALGA
ncbi:hypothetical protein FRB90_007507 [Tulasnella sp. 427]|nr:hypothetical protein FRB90_007507 [Tulasnella sp. 427]